MKRTRLKRKSKTELAKTRDKADRLLTPIIKKIYPRCEACGHETEVGHHFIEKSRSNHLRYHLDNIIALCHSCHYKIHNRNGHNTLWTRDIQDIIIEKRGDDWYKWIRGEEHKPVKADLLYFQTHLEKLQAKLKELDE